MEETPVVSYEEVPVPEPNLFLLHKQNLQFIKRVHDCPIGIGTSDDMSRRELNATFKFIFGFVIIVFLLLVLDLGCVLLLGLLTLVFVFSRPSKKNPDDYDLAGWILPGEIVTVRKIRVRSGHFISEKFVISYLFTAPDGKLREGKATEFKREANYRTSPPVGTPIRVWYPDKGDYSLL